MSQAMRAECMFFMDTTTREQGRAEYGYVLLYGVLTGFFSPAEW